MLNLKPIHTSLSPNSQKDDVILALKLLFQPWRNVSNLENKFKEYSDAKYAFSVNSGRSALFVILKALGIKNEDEVLIQAFTCNAVANPISWAGGRPVYVDIDDSLNISPEDLKKKITQNSKAVVIQHTFGVPANIDEISQIAEEHNLVLIEDCAHALGAKYRDKKVGTFGDISFFSFGRDKVASSVWGGMITTNNGELAEYIRNVYGNIPEPSRLWTIKQLLHPVLFSIIVPTYYIFGKYFLAALRKVNGITLAVSSRERVGQKPDMFPKRMPGALAALALHQLKKLEKYNSHRRKIASIYKEGLNNLPGIILPSEKSGSIYLRFNILHKKSDEIINNAKQKHIMLGDWYKNVIDPRGTVLEKVGYKPGSCPNAEFASKNSVNLPTHINISENDAQNIIKFLQNKQAHRS